MQGFYSSILSDPMYYIGLIFAFLAALSFLVFLRGGLSGLPGLFTQSAHDDHQHHHRVRVTWGVMMLLFLFMLWELLKWTIAFFNGQAGGFWTLVWLVIFWLLLLVVPFVF
jgi:hypothetical protein